MYTADVAERKNRFKILGGGDTNSGYWGRGTCPKYILRFRGSTVPARIVAEDDTGHLTNNTAVSDCQHVAPSDWWRCAIVIRSQERANQVWTWDRGSWRTIHLQHWLSSFAEQPLRENMDGPQLSSHGCYVVTDLASSPSITTLELRILPPLTLALCASFTLECHFAVNTLHNAWGGGTLRKCFS